PLQLASPPLSLADDPTDNVVYAGLDTGLVTINPATATMVATNSAFTGATEALFVDTPDHILWALNSLHGLVGYELPGLSTTLTAGIGAGQTGIRTLAFDPTTDELFLPVNTSGTSEIAVVDASTGTVVSADLLSAPDLASLAYDPVDGSVYALGQNISIINASTLTLDFVPLPIAPHVGAGTIVYDASRGYLFASTWTAADSGTLTEIDGQSVDAAFAGETVMGVGHSPVAVLPIEVPGSSPSVPSEVWVANSLAGTLSIVANSPPQIVAFSALPGTVDPGENTTFVLTVTGGAGPVDISYAGLPSGCASTNTSRLNCTPESAGTYTVTATVTDGLGNSAQANTTLVVDEGLAVHLFEATNTFPEVELGTELIVGVDPTGGAAPYTYAWSFGDGTYGSGPIIEHLYGARGSYLLQVNATDGVGGRASLVWGIDVFAPPTLKGTASSLSTDVGVPVVLTAAPQGGWGNGTTVWSFGDGTGASGTRVTHDWTARGVYDVTVNYTDALGDRTNWSTQVRVNDSPSGTFLVLAATGAAPGEPGTLFYYNATLSGGTGPFTVTWHFGDGSEAVGLLVTHSYGAAGNYSVTVNATDAVGGSVAASLAVEVVAPSPASGGPTLSFSLGILLGLVVGAALAAVAVFEATRRRGRGRTPPPPPSPYVPPAPHQAWKED
ncbi:MAG TPA: PKD domain-containing protein, partial [Thermoplasmata archaeon]|nr:PKD domain-containing protein [Thermoplasmata archaeon]